MNVVARAVIALLVLFAAFCFLYWFPFSFFPFGGGNWISTSLAFLCAAAIAWLVWLSLKARGIGPGSSMFLGAVFLGAIGFSAGFFGPMILAPSASQGPLLGIFVTGPLGFIIGGIIGLVFWYVRIHKNPD